MYNYVLVLCTTCVSTTRITYGAEKKSLYVVARNFCPLSKTYKDFFSALYRGGNKGMFVLLIRTQAGPGRTVKQEQEEISPNHAKIIEY